MADTGCLESLSQAISPPATLTEQANDPYPFLMPPPAGKRPGRSGEPTPVPGYGRAQASASGHQDLTAASRSPVASGCRCGASL
jgi:hypothetical protein